MSIKRALTTEDFTVIDTVTNLKTLQPETVGLVTSFLWLKETARFYYWDRTSTATNNDITVIQVTSISTGRWRDSAVQLTGNKYIPVSNTTDVVDAAFLNSAYPIANFEIGTRVDYTAQNMLYTRTGNATWNFTPTNPLT